MAELLWQWWSYNLTTGKWSRSNPATFYTEQEVIDHIEYMLKGNYDVSGSIESIEFSKYSQPVRYRWVLTSREREER